MKRTTAFTSIIVSLFLIAGTAANAMAQELIVSAAASLTDAFNDIEPAFEAAHPNVDVIMNFASSGALYRQIEQGAPADVYASANPKWMNKAVTKGFVNQADTAIFARNSLVLATPADNPAHIKTLADLTGQAVKSIGIGTPETVPAGQYAKGALTSKDLYATLTPKMIFGESVRQILDYLSRDEIDCGFVYRTDAVKAGKNVTIIEEVPLEKPVTYPIAVLSQSDKQAMATAFVHFVRSDAGADLLEGRGFKRP
ncbi:molybdate ABC transporter substrate-binding protein [Pseudodesulfovibrio sp. JC047]|uniref:molybdate ABC transporter substrate-binding protein n=1 Tax=Pseudodesulfovibrio sp. JC047 TaxID=2683199 RepID=UPI0013D4212F|nr:molybdate ABC transporter substrate-binding protein [Pseudodesulfovibrio sp. JC047]NDV19721.1 molybdate ABC transporter substrate-binding protein [Pseudodesulfovibrio sp. JC047]